MSCKQNEIGHTGPGVQLYNTGVFLLLDNLDVLKIKLRKLKKIIVMHILL